MVGNWAFKMASLQDIKDFNARKEPQAQPLAAFVSRLHTENMLGAALKSEVMTSGDVLLQDEYAAEWDTDNPHAPLYRAKSVSVSSPVNKQVTWRQYNCQVIVNPDLFRKWKAASEIAGEEDRLRAYHEICEIKSEGMEVKALPGSDCAIILDGPINTKNPEDVDVAKWERMAAYRNNMAKVFSPRTASQLWLF